MGTAKFKTTSDIRDVERDLDKMRKDYAKLAEQIRGTGQESKRSGKAGQQAAKDQTTATNEHAASLKRAQRQIIGMVGGWGLMKSAIGLVKRDFEAYVELQRESAKIQRELGADQSTTLLNLAGLTTKERKAVLESAARIQDEAAFPDQGPIQQALGATVSAGATPAEAIDAVTAAAKLTRQAPSMLPFAAGAAVDLQRATKVEGAEENLGFMLSAAQFSRVKDFAKIGQNLPPSVSAALTSVSDQDPREAAKQSAAIFGDISQRLTDFSGDITKTASRQLTSGLRTFFDEGMGGAQVMGPFRDPQAMDTLFGRMEVLARDVELKKTFLENAPLGEAKAVIEEMLTPEGLAGLRKAESGITFDPKLTRELQAQGGSLTPELRAGKAEARMDAAVQQAGQDRGTAGTAREILAKALKQDTGTGFLGDFMATRAFDFRERILGVEDPVVAAQAILKGQIKTNRFAQDTSTAFFGKDAGLSGPEIISNTKLLREAIQSLEDLKNEVKASNVELRAQNVELQGANRALQGGGAAAQVGAANNQ